MIISKLEFLSLALIHFSRGVQIITGGATFSGGCKFLSGGVRTPTKSGHGIMIIIINDQNIMSCDMCNKRSNYRKWSRSRCLSSVRMMRYTTLMEYTLWSPCWGGSVVLSSWYTLVLAVLSSCPETGSCQLSLNSTWLPRTLDNWLVTFCCYRCLNLSLFSIKINEVYFTFFYWLKT